MMPSIQEKSSRNILSGTSLMVVEDDLDLREALVDTLELAKADVMAVESAESACAALQEYVPDMIITDVNMGAMNGHELLAYVKQKYPQVPVLLMTAYGSITQSVDAIRNGAVDYLVKPFQPQELIDTVHRYVSYDAQCDADEPVAEEASSKQVLQLAQRVAETDSTVLICGESGTGKEVLARYLHNQSSRATGPFVAINCAAIPENMLEAMLFGHEKGAFTGAYSSAPGKFEQADGGTLLLDEISEMDIGLQAKLLRVIQEREVERLGGRKTISLDVRIIATTNRNLLQTVADGKFREDLYYRLSVFPLQWQPLRQRPKDILPIAERLLQRHAKKMNRNVTGFDTQAEQALLAYEWPGNIRELDNVMQRALIMSSDKLISVSALRLDPFDAFSSPAVSHHNVNVPGESIDLDKSGMNNLDGDLKQREFEIILDVLKDEGGSRKNAAERLGISPRTLRYKLAKMRELGISLDRNVLAG